MRHFLVLSMILFSLSSYVHANSEILKLKLDILESLGVYESTEIPGEYEQTSHYEKIRTRVYREQPGGGEELVLDKKEEMSAGVKEEGYSKLKLVNLGGKVYLLVDQLVKDTEEDFSHLSQYNAEVRLVEGTWEDYQNGRDLTLKLTPEGHRTILENVAAELKAYLEEGPEEDNVEVKIDNMSVNDTIKANLSKIEILIEKMSFSGTLTPLTGE